MRASTESDDRLETGMRETEVVTAVEIDHEAKAQYEESRRQSAGRAETATGFGEPPTPDDTDAIETAGRERVDAHATETAGRESLPPQQSQPPQRASQPSSTAQPRTSQPLIPNIPAIAPIAPRAAAPATATPAAPTTPTAPATPKLPISTAPASLPPPKTASLPTSGPSPACPQCESPMAWVEEHLRFYCKSCRMYF